MTGISPTSSILRSNQVVLVNNHAEVVVGKKLALIDVEDVPRIKGHLWMEHPRGPISQVVISRFPVRRRRYTLMSCLLHGLNHHFKNGDNYDLRKTNIGTGEPKTLPRKNPRKLGIFYHKGDWYAQIREAKVQKVMCFSATKYTVEGAFKLALAARRKMVELGFDSARKMINEIRRRGFNARVNIYDGNSQYQDCVVEIPFTEDGTWDGYHIA